MSLHLSTLCCCIIEKFYGEFYARLFTHLTYHGRLSAQQLAQKTHLPLKRIRTGLASLVQSRLIYYHTTPEGSSTYQANLDVTYNLLRTGRLIELAHDEIGETAARIISEACLLGFMTVGELEARSIRALSEESPAQGNGSPRRGPSTFHLADDVRSVIEQLLQNGYLHNLRSAYFETDFDIRQDIERDIKDSGRLQALKGKKALEEAEATIQAERQRRLTSNTKEYGNVPESSSNANGTHYCTTGEPSSKRQKINGDTFVPVNGHVWKPPITDPALLVCVNYENVVSSIRNDYLKVRASKSLGDINSRVLAAALSQIAVSRPRLQMTDDNSLDLEWLRDRISQPQGQRTARNSRQNGPQINGVQNEELRKEEGYGVTFSELDRCLELLADSEFRFLKGQPREWEIDKRELDLFIQRRELLRLMGDRLQPPSLRIIRMLMEKGKLDEKALQEIGLLGAKELRQTLAQLKQGGFIDLQEVPKEAQRQPNRTIYLWFYDAERVRKLLLENLYKTMTRLLQRLKFERHKLLSTLDKVERHGVDVLGTAERVVWKRWLVTEKWLLGEMGRLDESVALLRDL